MLLLSPGVQNDIVEIAVDAVIDQVAEDFANDALECRGCVLESEGKNKPLVVSALCHESSLWNVI